jgi:hypothetical protein
LESPASVRTSRRTSIRSPDAGLKPAIAIIPFDEQAIWRLRALARSLPLKISSKRWAASLHRRWCPGTLSSLQGKPARPEDLHTTLGVPFYRRGTQDKCSRRLERLHGRGQDVFDRIGVDKSKHAPEAWSGIVEGNTGKILTDRLGGEEEGIVCAEIDLSSVIPRYFGREIVGHYWPKPFTVLFDDSERKPMVRVRRSGERSADAKDVEPDAFGT